MENNPMKTVSRLSFALAGVLMSFAIGLKTTVNTSSPLLGALAAFAFGLIYFYVFRNKI